MSQTVANQCVSMPCSNTKYFPQVLAWEAPEGEMVAYRSFKPFEPLLASPYSPVKLWAVWAIAHVCLRNPARYCAMLEREAGSQLIRALAADGERLHRTVEELPRTHSPVEGIANQPSPMESQSSENQLRDDSSSNQSAKDNVTPNKLLPISQTPTENVENQPMSIDHQPSNVMNQNQASPSHEDQPTISSQPVRPTAMDMSAIRLLGESTVNHTDPPVDTRPAGVASGISACIDLVGCKIDKAVEDEVSVLGGKVYPSIATIAADIVDLLDRYSSAPPPFDEFEEVR